MRLNYFSGRKICILSVLLVIFPYFLCFAGGIPENTLKKSRRQIADIADPQKLAEIIDKAIQADGEGEGSGSSALDLPVKGTVTSTVGLRHDPIDGELRIHNGIDIAIPEGTAVTPVAAGKVVYSGYQTGYGNMIIVRHDDGMITLYAHNSRNITKAAAAVDTKTRIALSGSTGRSTGPHLHFEAWQGGKNVTRAFLPDYAGRHISASSEASLDKTNLRKVILSDGTILFVEFSRAKN
jgi:murein DD-endopeptidase MepM/ murein hydrolase activator NlpD